ncbi:Flp pilus assembly protein CpaB [Burkholderia sp. WAC0059]|uniref:Flp pilus assembly protein CpaB n=1 Tax=Burkholderia sp. WAC0059 TaxID=2066022 RepID=UPI000C7EA35D|nr:Flp pilus assembly protein CpaB [Burkholderia sp. WAC0059]PLZ03358.1 Flp pilus assembly protein CpaB [Burkholderia sp. WAC0059]
MPNLTKIAAVLLIAFALLLGALAWTLARRPLPHPVLKTAQASFPVVVATRALPAGQPIPAGALRVQPLPIRPDGAFSSPAQLSGRVPVAGIGANAPVLEAELSNGLTTQIAPGERAVAVRVDEYNAVGARLRPGNFVDVFFTLRREGGAGTGEVAQTQARLLLSKIRVLAFGNASLTSDASGDATRLARTAVLAVPVADIDRLELAESAGRLIFALRNPADDGVIDDAALPPLPAVLRTSATAGGGPDGEMHDMHDMRDSTRAAAGVALAALSGEADGAAAQAAPRRAPPRRTGRTTTAATPGLEVIRGGRAETVAW